MNTVVGCCGMFISVPMEVFGCRAKLPTMPKPVPADCVIGDMTGREVASAVPVRCQCGEGMERFGEILQVERV